jgi:hypothetical protein
LLDHSRNIQHDKNLSHKYRDNHHRENRLVEK